MAGVGSTPQRRLFALTRWSNRVAAFARHASAAATNGRYAASSTGPRVAHDQAKCRGQSRLLHLTITTITTTMPDGTININIQSPAPPNVVVMEGGSTLNINKWVARRLGAS